MIKLKIIDLNPETLEYTVRSLELGEGIFGGTQEEPCCDISRIIALITSSKKVVVIDADKLEKIVEIQLGEEIIKGDIGIRFIQKPIS